METPRLIPPVKALWRDGHKIVVQDIPAFVRHLAQPFGVNWAPGNIYINMGLLGHDGIDIAVPVGEKIFASHAGIVLEADNNDDGDGLGIVLYDPEQDIITWYWHNSLNYVKVDDYVKVGQLIALSGGTGKAYGPHLHFQLLRTDDNGGIINIDNGYRGGIDPVPYLHMPVVNTKEMEEIFIKDMYNFYFGRTPTTDEAAFWLGKNYRDLLKAMLRDKLSLFE